MELLHVCAQAVEQPAQDPHRVGNRAAEISAVDGTPQAGDLDVHLHQAAQLERQRGDAGRDVVGVGEHHDVRLDPVDSPAQIFLLRRKLRTERDFDYFL